MDTPQTAIHFPTNAESEIFNFESMENGKEEEAKGNSLSLKLADTSKDCSSAYKDNVEEEGCSFEE